MLLFKNTYIVGLSLTKTERLHTNKVRPDWSLNPCPVDHDNISCHSHALDLSVKLRSQFDRRASRAIDQQASVQIMNFSCVGVFNMHIQHVQSITWLSTYMERDHHLTARCFVEETKCTKLTVHTIMTVMNAIVLV